MLATIKNFNKTVIGSTFFAALMIALAIIGGVISYSPVPFWDMWSAPEFYSEILNQNYQMWWKQHNEHRIILSRILFWIDNDFFEGNSIFLIVMNYVFVAIVAYVFWKILRLAKKNKEVTNNDIILIGLITSGLFFWIQEENFTWAFQSQFFLVQLLPLAGLYFLSKFLVEDKKIDLIASCLLGMLSAGTMANGVLILPMMVFFLLLFQGRRIYALLPLVLSIVTLFYYFHDFYFPGNGVSFFTAFQEKPLDFIAYIFMYLGNPFHYLFGKGWLGEYCALVAGLVFAAIAIYFSLQVLRKKYYSPVFIALLFFVFYISITALVTARGRFVLGVDQALSSRYTTPTITAWCAISMLLYLSNNNIFRSFFSKINSKLIWLILIILVLGQQSSIFRQSHDIETREIAALALALNIKDEKLLLNIYPDATGVLKMAQQAIRENTSLFQSYPYHDVPKKFGTTYQGNNEILCKVALVNTEIIPDVNDFMRVTAEFENTHILKRRNLLYFRDEAGVVVGFALKSKENQFKGYVTSKNLNHSIDVIDTQAKCYGVMLLK